MFHWSSIFLDLFQVPLSSLPALPKPAPGVNRAQIDGIAQKYGISYINFDKYNDAIGLDYSKDTPDAGSHLNDSGAAKFSGYLADLIKKEYDVSDRRNESAYVDYWNKKGEM